MKKTSSFLLGLLLAFGLLLGNLSPASAMDGTPCNRIGATKKVEGAKYVCIKFGKKLTWSSGRKIATNKSIESPSSLPSPTSEQAKTLKLQAELQPDSILRLELNQDLYLGHCLSFLVYDWGVADSYEGIFYRQKKEYEIPVNLNNQEELPRSFTFECQNFPAQSYSFNWILADERSNVTVKKLTSVVIADKVTKKLPKSSLSLLPGSIAAYIPDVERTMETISILEDGRNAHETSITYRSSIPKDICSAKILNQEGKEQKLEELGPNYFDSRSGLIRSGFDRINSWGYLAYKGYKEENLKLEINCTGAGTYALYFLHPAPLVPISAFESGPCPVEYEGKVSQSLKPSQISLTCTKNNDGKFIWRREKPKTGTTSPSPTPSGKPSDLTDAALKAQLKAITSLGLKANKISENLVTLKSKLSSKRSSAATVQRIDDLSLKAKDIYSLSKTTSGITSRQAASSLANQVAKSFNLLEEEYGELMEEIG